MLYERWLEVARADPSGLALADLAVDRRWTFSQLAAVGESAAAVPGPCAFPQGAGAEFVSEVLRAWRDGLVVFPLDQGQVPPMLATNFPSEVVHLKATSATTGAARLVAFTGEQLAADVENICATMGLRPDWPNVGVISLAHSYGFSSLVLPLLLKGIPLILCGSTLPEAVRQAAAACRACALPAVPALWRTWQETRSIPAQVRLAVSAGAPLPVALEQAVHRQTGLKIHNFYGSSECGGIAYDGTELPRADACYVGTPLSGVEVSVGVDGCLEVCSQAVGATCWPEPDDRLGNGRFRTGDLGEVTAAGIFLRGRVGDVINVAGRKVLPETVEQVLAGHRAVRACVVFGIPTGTLDRGEAIVACAALNEPIGIEPLRQFLLESLPAWQVPRQWWLVDALGENHRGKVSRAEWRRRFLAREAATSGSAS